MNYSRKDFIDEICREISFKEAHKPIKEELEIHIDDLIENYIEKGFEEKEALIGAMQSMGNPKEIGYNLNKVHSTRIQWQVVIATGTLSFMGVIVLFLLGEFIYGNSIIFGIKQLISVVIGTFSIILIYHVNYRKLIYNGKLLYFGGMLLTLATVMFGNRVSGSTFFQIGSISFEAAKFYNLIFLISIIGILAEVRGNNVIGLVKIIAYTVFTLFCLYINSNMGIVVIMAIVYLLIITMAILKNYFFIRKKWTCLIVLYGLVGFIIGICILLQNKATNLSNNFTDCEFVIIVSKFGWKFTVILVAMFIILIGSMILSTLKMKSMVTFYLSTAIVIYLICTCAIGFITSLGFLHGINSNIPFISFGATNYITDCMLIGIFLSMWRRNLIVERDM